MSLQNGIPFHRRCAGITDGQSTLLLQRSQ